jgi:hypothetical protein
MQRLPCPAGIRPPPYEAGRCAFFKDSGGAAPGRDCADGFLQKRAGIGGLTGATFPRHGPIRVLMIVMNHAEPRGNFLILKWPMLRCDGAISQFDFLRRLLFNGKSAK